MLINNLPNLPNIQKMQLRETRAGGLARFKSELLQCNHSDLKRACGVKGGGAACGEGYRSSRGSCKGLFEKKKNNSHRRGASRVMDPPHVLTFDEQLKWTTL